MGLEIKRPYIYSNHDDVDISFEIVAANVHKVVQLDVVAKKRESSALKFTTYVRAYLAPNVFPSISNIEDSCNDINDPLITDEIKTLSKDKIRDSKEQESDVEQEEEETTIRKQETIKDG